MQGPVAERLRESLESADPGIVSVYLFGSHAEARAHRQSDVDVGVLLDRGVYPQRGQRSELRVDLTTGLVAALRCDDVDVVILNDAPPLLARRVVLDGIRVLCRDEAADQAFRRDVQLRAADLSPFLEKMRRIKLEALRE